MNKIRVCGVPEHFNYPWQLCIENNTFKNQNLDVQWTDVPQGTGKMCEMLRDETTDIAIILTEGIIKDIAFGNKSKIIQLYVESPLIWGIHVDYNSDFKSVEDLEHKKVAISRLGSGSHLMAFLHANKMQWAADQLDFEIINTIDGAVNALLEKKADYFMWEKLMTKPLVDQKIFRRLSEYPTPWPSFVIAVTDSFLETNSESVAKLVQIINKKTQTFKDIKNIANKIAIHFNLDKNDVSLWLKSTYWSQRQLSEDMLNKIQNQLFDLKLIDKKVTFVHATATL